MPEFTYKSVKVAYEHRRPLRTYDESQPFYKTPILLLHGWGTRKETFASIIDDLSGFVSVYALDFPGFGDSDEPDSVWNLDAYCDMVIAFMAAQHIESPVILGHSFGGRVAIKLTQRIPMSKLILVNSAGIRPKRKTSYYFKVWGVKCFNQLNKIPGLHFLLDEPLKAYREKYSSQDYKNASPIMRRVLSVVVNEDLTFLLPKINVPTLMIWGDQDTATPIQDAKLMEGTIPDAGLVVFEGAGHFSYLEQPLRFNTILKTFIGGL